MATVAEWLRAGDDLPGDSPRRDSEILLSHVLGKSRTWLYTWPESPVDTAHATVLARLLQQRRDGVPVAYLTGQREFWSLPLQVNKATLIPRPETETLVEWALELVLPAAAAVLDLGTGSGAIALALASERADWEVVAVDASADALAIARANGEQLCPGRVRFVQSDWFSALPGNSWDLIVSNPPYVESDSPYLERGDLRFEPRGALVSGASGLEDITRLAAAAPHHLRPGGWVLLEHGHRQGAAVRGLLQAADLEQVITRCDLAGHERITGARRAD
ncbi:peptide chain release factor N(5)-glutamine methyltransferase [Kineobactrum sediminis]|uniref:Release factor glutamine methyltransferase n=1 Tax=Kineobactrum sediminis TaxID=1905677 RepID=A0A2N5Y3C4_9GAMM|nr:peptide chain release factor N(5)-glutamine methyltransferase [Kineobactrum sediminis]PLW82891.1 peptide chain release factor N(5)-glutamine methyltransferase [Kineobactrum sediminis]